MAEFNNPMFILNINLGYTALSLDHVILELLGSQGLIDFFIV